MLPLDPALADPDYHDAFSDGMRPMGEDGAIPERDDIPAEYRWDLERIYADDEEWYDDLASVEERIEQLDAYEGRVTEDAGTLQEVLDFRRGISRDLSKLSTYARYRHHEDMRHDQYQQMQAAVSRLSSEKSATERFIKVEIRDADEERIQAMMGANDDLEPFEPYLEGLVETREHGLGKEAEQVLGRLRAIGTPKQTYQTLKDADMTFPTMETPSGEEFELSLGSYGRYSTHPDREFRRELRTALFDTFDDYHNTMGELFKNAIEEDVDLATIRNYDSARQMHLKPDDIPEEVYDNLIATVQGALEPLHRHFDLKAAVLGVDELKSWDLSMPLAESRDPDIPYSEAMEHVLAAVEPFGDAYQEVVETAFDEGWIDVYENRGKRGGAYSGGVYDAPHPFILMNYSDDLSSVYTLAHEMGHAVHRHLRYDEQPYRFSGAPIFTAEVASNVNEILLTDHLMDTFDDPDLQRHVLSHFISSKFSGSLMSWTRLADFEHRVHEHVEDGNALTPDTIDGIYRDTLADYYDGSRFSFDERSEKGWMTVHHFYRPYYGFQYATGVSAALSLTNQIREEGDDAVDRYLTFLEHGSRKDPLPLLQDAGVDMSSPEPVLDALWEYNERLDEMEKLLKDGDII